MNEFVLLVLATAMQGSTVPDLDAVAAAPKNHRVILENDQVRVLQVELLPGETEPVHEHRWPAVMHIQSAQPAIDISYALKDGKLVEIARRRLAGGTPPPAIWVPRQGPHAVQNLGSEPYRLLRVELKQASADAQPSPQILQTPPPGTPVGRHPPAPPPIPPHR